MFMIKGSGPRSRIIGLYALLIAANLLAWAWALIAFHGHPLLLAAAAGAFGLGLRHAVDADHIAAIDNVTRKLLHDGQRPLAVGFFFSLGHSTVVFLLTLLIARTAHSFGSGFRLLLNTGAIVGVSVSALFLFVIAGANALVFLSVWRRLQRVRRGDSGARDSVDIMLAGGGPIARVCRRLFGLIRHSWQMYPLGFLFGLGFDTASEVGLLAMSAIEGSKGLPLANVLVFPSLFLAGMSLVDTTDGVVMLGAYGWALVKPIRKLYYNLSMTLVSVLVALAIGSFELSGLIGRHFPGNGTFWNIVSSVNENSALTGYSVIAVFVLGWLGAILAYRVKRPADIRQATS
jgi:high-affinity nickel-transport protein